MLLLLQKKNCGELGIDAEKLEAMAVENRPSFIVQKKAEMLKERCSYKYE